MLIVDALVDMRDSYEMSGRADNTLRIIERAVSNLAAHVWAERPDDPAPALADIKRGDIVAFLAHEKRRGQSPASLSMTARSIKTFTKYCVTVGFTTTDPAKGIPSVHVPAKPMAYLDDNEVATLLTSIEADTTLVGRRDLALLSLLADTGLRRSELLGLTIDDLDLDARTATIRAETSKVRRAKRVAYSPRTALAIRRYLTVRDAYLQRTDTDIGTALWVGSKRERLQANGALQMLHRRLEAAEVRTVGLHSFRHRWAAKATREGMPLSFLMVLGGWSSPAMVTRVYGQATVQDDAIAHANGRFATQKGGRS